MKSCQRQRNLERKGNSMNWLIQCPYKHPWSDLYDHCILKNSLEQLSGPIYYHYCMFCNSSKHESSVFSRICCINEKKASTVVKWSVQTEITREKQMHGLKVSNLKSLQINKGDQLEIVSNYFILALRVFNAINIM